MTPDHGIPGSWFPGSQDPGVPVSWHPGIPGFWDPRIGILESWDPWVRGSWDPGIPGNLGQGLGYLESLTGWSRAYSGMLINCALALRIDVASYDRSINKGNPPIN